MLLIGLNWLMTFRPSLCPARAAADFRASPTMKLWAGPDWLAEIAKLLAGTIAGTGMCLIDDDAFGGCS